MNWFEITVVTTLIIVAVALLIIAYGVYKPKGKDRYLISFSQSETQEIALTLEDYEKELPNILIFGTDNSPIEFPRLDFPSIDSGKKAESIIKSAVKQSVPSAVIDAATMYGARGLYKATVSPSQLLKYSDGTVSSMVKGSKGIASHSGFSQASTAGIFVPIIIFQVASIVTGQYYLNGITKQLSAIAQRLEFLIKLHHNEKISTLQAHYERLVKLADPEKSTYGIEDLIELGAIRRDANAIHKEYINLLNEIDEHAFYSAQNDNHLARTMVKELQKRFEESNIIFIVNLLLFSRRVLFAAKLLEMKVNIFLAQKDRNRISTITNSIAELGELKKEVLVGEEKVQNIFNCLKDVAEKTENLAWLESSKTSAQKLYEQYSEKAKKVTNDINEATKDVVNMVDLINERMDQKKEAYVLIGNKGEVIPIGKIDD